MLPNLRRKKLIGSGSFGSVYIAKWNGGPVAVKTLHERYIREPQAQQTFLSVWSRMQNSSKPLAQKRGYVIGIYHFTYFTTNADNWTLGLWPKERYVFYWGVGVCMLTTTTHHLLYLLSSIGRTLGPVEQPATGKVFPRNLKGHKWKKKVTSLLWTMELCWLLNLRTTEFSRCCHLFTPLQM